MKVLLISPASGQWKGVGNRKIFRGRVFRFSMLSLLSVAAETPGDAEVRIVDEQIMEIPWNEPFDLVGITTMTAAAPRAYEISRRFREKGIPVVLGGMHPTFLPEEALGHADAVCVGEAEGVWKTIVRDAEAGRLKGVYRADGPIDLARLSPPPRHLIAGDHYVTIQAVQATRGCPHRCAFCSVSAFHGGEFRMRPVDRVVAEIKEFSDRFFVFTDDSLTADPDYARELFKALVPLKKHWISQATLRITDHPDLVRLAEQSGCIGLFVGLESFSTQNLEGVGKEFNRVSEYRERVQMLHDHSISVEAGMVFGFDTDREDVFRSTLDMTDNLKIDLAQISILTPIPGTSQFEAMKDRIIEDDWSCYDYHHPVVQPAGMSVESLKAGHDWITREFYSPWRIARRLARISTMKRGWRVLPVVMAISMAYFGRVRTWGIRGYNPAEYRKESRVMELQYGR